MKNNYQTETELFLNNQIELGFKPKWFITFHYHHPAEKCWKVIEKYKPLGYGNRRLNQEWKHEFPNLFFFHEKGKVKLQYHTHLLIPEKNCKFTNTNDLYRALNSNIRKKRKCFSKWKTIHIREVDNPYLALSYVNKETCKEHNSLDYQNSIFIRKNL
jgi:hypothetical protein